MLTQGYFFFGFYRERNGERETLTGSLLFALRLGIEPELRYVFWPGIEPAAFVITG